MELKFTKGLAGEYFVQVFDRTGDSIIVGVIRRESQVWKLQWEHAVRGHTYRYFESFEDAKDGVRDAVFHTVRSQLFDYRGAS